MFCSFVFFNFLLQSLALSACTTLVSLEPRLPMETRNLVMKVAFETSACWKPWAVSASFYFLLFFLINVITITGDIRIFYFAKGSFRHGWSTSKEPYYSAGCHSPNKVLFFILPKYSYRYLQLPNVCSSFSFVMHGYVTNLIVFVHVLFNTFSVQDLIAGL